MGAANDNPHQLLLRVLTDPPAGYRRWMRPADIIEQCRMERRKRKSIGLADLLQKLKRSKSKD